jgi:hypothetical protein
MVINAGDVETCRRTWTRGIGAAARSAARQILRADARRSPSAARQGAGGELDRVLRAYLDDRHLKNWIDGLPSTAQSAGRALLTRRFFRIAALESGHYVLDYMVAGLAWHFSASVAATIDVPPEALEEIVWVDLASWLFQSLRKQRSAYIPTAPTSDADEEDELSAAYTETIDERLARLLPPVAAETDPVLDRLRALLTSVFGAAAPSSESADRMREEALREPGGSAKRRSTSATRAETRGESDLWWDAGRVPFEALARWTVLGQYSASRNRFRAHAFTYSPAGRALRAFAGAANVNRVVYTVDCQERRVAASATEPGREGSRSQSEPGCRHGRHTLRYPDQLVECGCDACQDTARVARLATWLVVATPEYGAFSSVAVCPEKGCRRLARDASPVCVECGAQLEIEEVWHPHNPVDLDAFVHPHDGARQRIHEHVAAAGPTVADQVATKEYVRSYSSELAERRDGIMADAGRVRELAWQLLDREIADIAQEEPPSWTRLAVLAALCPGLDAPTRHGWEVRLLVNVFQAFRDREGAIAALPARLRSAAVAVPTQWTTHPLKPPNFGKIKSEMAARWLEWEPSIKTRLVKLLDPSLIEALDDVDALLEQE